MIFPEWPYYSSQEIKKIKEILSSGKVNYWTGKLGRLFEKEFADFCSCKYALTIANGSLALSAAYLSLGIKKVLKRKKLSLKKQVLKL